MATTNSPVVNPTPKNRFLANTADVQTHRGIVQNPNFQKSLDFALMEYQGQLASATVPDSPTFFNNCAANHLRIQGVMQFIHILKGLGEKPVAPVIVDRDNLDQRS